jgi:serine/threonine protein kinase
MRGFALWLEPSMRWGTTSESSIIAEAANDHPSPPHSLTCSPAGPAAADPSTAHSEPKRPSVSDRVCATPSTGTPVNESSRAFTVGPGHKFGGFVIEAVVGRGGMGIVYRARQLNPERRVALKVIAPDLADNPTFYARFQREATIAAQIEHPNVIPVYTAGDEHGTLFIAMRFVDGTDLGAVLAKDVRLQPKRAATIIDQVAQALDAAHSQGLVHRDVKPANILIATTGAREHVYLTDFGLSRHAEASSGLTLTGTGAFLGTIDYAAPEQVRGERIDARTDVYALGCVLFHALTGTVPFPASNDLAKLYAHATQSPPTLGERAPTVPVAFDAILARAMAKAPGDRYLSAGDLGRAALAAASGKALSFAERSVASGEAAPRAASIRRGLAASRPPAPAPKRSDEPRIGRGLAATRPPAPRHRPDGAEGPHDRARRDENSGSPAEAE